MAQPKTAMQHMSFQRPVPALNHLVRVCALAVLLIGLLVLAGWGLKIDVLKSVLPGLTSMKPNTALCFVLAGIALAQRQRSGLRLACAAAMLLLGGLSLAQDVTGANFGTDELLFRDTPGAAQTIHPGRMSPITAVGILLLGGALTLLGTRRAALRWTLELMALLALGLALIALIGYLYDAKVIFPLPGFSSMALLTPPALALLGLGILCAQVDGLAGVFASPGRGGLVARRFLPLAVIAPVLLGWLVQRGENAGLFDATHGTAVIAAAMVLVLVVLSWRNELSLEASDAERQQGREAQARLAMIVETSDDAIISRSIDGIIQTWNAGAERMFGYSSEEVVGKSITLLIPPERLPEEKEILQHLRSGTAIDHYETMRLTRDGRRLDVSLTTSPLKDADGRVIGASKIIRDITERKHADAALRASEAFNRSIIKSSPDCIKVLDLDGNLLSVQSGQELLGIDDIQPFLDRSWLNFWTPKERPAVQAAIESAAAGGAGSFVGFTRTSRGESKWWDVVISPILDTNGKPDRLLAVSRDVTQRQQGEKALRASEARFRALFDRGPIAIYSCDVAGTIQEYNACAVKLWGQAPKPGDTFEWFRRSLKFYLPDGTLLTRSRSKMAQVLKGDLPSVNDQEFIFERPDGSRITIIANIVPLINGRGEVTGAVCCFYDITERSRLERKTLEQAQALADLDRRKDEFLAMLGHELRNPLAAIVNAAQLLRRQPDEAPLQQQARQVIERQVGQLKHLVDDLLEVSRITSGSVRLRQEQVSMSGVVERAVETAQPLIAQRRHALTVSLPSQPLFLYADAARLEQVLVNLLTNAAKYTDEGGHIWLSLEQEKTLAVLRVRDNGIGITPELLPRIFELFTQAERSLDRAQGGLGIGLSLVQQLVELHGGSVEAHSVLGQGSEFVVRLPVMQMDLPAAATLTPTPAAAPALDTAPPPDKAATFCRVLVVDDNVDAAQSLATLLEMTGHQVRLAYDGPSAVEAAIDYQPEVVLLDIGLPGLDGFEVARQIRHQDALKHVVLVALTGYGQDTDRQRSQDAGFDYHLVKPVDFDEVEKILLSVLQNVSS